MGDDGPKDVDALPPMTKQGLEQMNLYKEANEELTGTNNKLRKQVGRGWETTIGKECCKYNKIPWFKFGFMGKTYTKKSRGDCESLCNRYLGCLSYSFNMKTKTCIYSSASLQYDDNWRFESKKVEENGKKTANYDAFPGLKFLEPTVPILTNQTLETCKYSCTKDFGCSGFSFSNVKDACSK